MIDHTGRRGISVKRENVSKKILVIIMQENARNSKLSETQT